MQKTPRQKSLLSALAAAALLVPLTTLPTFADETPASFHVPENPDWSDPAAGPDRASKRPPIAGWKARVNEWTDRVIPGLENLAASMWDRDRNITSDHLSQLASGQVRAMNDPEAAWETLQVLFDHQQMDPEADNYGQFAQNIWGACWYGLECYELGVNPYTKTTKDSWASISQTFTVTESVPHVFSAKLRGQYSYGHKNHHFFQVLVNGEIAHEEDVVLTNTSWRELELDLTEHIGSASEATLELRLFEKRAVAQHPVSIRFDEVTLTGTSLDGRVNEEGIWDEQSSGEGVHVLLGGATQSLDHTSFILSRLGAIMNSKDFRKFTPEQQQLMKERTRVAAWSQVDKPNMIVEYTNMRISRDISLLLIGQATGDRELYAKGVELWTEWFDWTRQHGIREYGSVTYYGVSLIKLMAGHSYVEDDALRAQIGDALDLFWFDMAANWFPGHHSVSGSQSRNYNFTHPGSPRTFTSVEGWEPMPEPMTEAQKKNAFGGNYQVVQVFDGKHVYHPPRAAFDLAMAPVKEVTAVAGENRLLDRYNYVTPHWAIGSTSDSYGGLLPTSWHPSPYDKAINMEFAGDREQGSLAVVPSWNTDPYGKERYHHAPLWPTTIQHKGSVLTQLDLNPSGNDLDATQRVPNFSTHVLVPGNADLALIDGEPVGISSLGEYAANTDSTFVLRVDQACVAVRVLGVEGVNGHTPTAALVVDEPGQAIGMARITLEQFDAPQAELLTTQSAPVTLFLQAADCPSDEAAHALAASVAAAPVTLEETDGVRSARVTTHDGTQLNVHTDTTARRPLSRDVNGVEFVAPSVLSVNGKDYTQTIFN